MVQGDDWKRWLIRDLRDLRDEMEGRNWAESESFRAAVVERFMFVTAYVSRKLLEGEELTIDLIEHAWPVKRYRCLRRTRQLGSSSVSRAI